MFCRLSPRSQPIQIPCSRFSIRSPATRSSGPAFNEFGLSMLIEIGHVDAIFRYPVKSMRGERLEAANLGWHGLDGDRRLALRRIDDRGGFPWLSASRLPELVLFSPQRHESEAQRELPTHVRTPDGKE